MKKLLSTLLFVSSLGLAWGQSPQSMTYQSVVRDATDALVASSPVGMQISILQSSPTGLSVYIETHIPSTNINGLVTIEIGNGTPVAGSFATIDWSAGPYFIKTEMDPNGGTTYSISGTSQLLSVPYALYAESTGSSFSGNYNDLTNTPLIPTTTSDLTNNSGFITSPNDADSDPNNEIQSLQLVGQDLTLSGSNTVTLPAGGGNTLDDAYDEGGAGAGRTITVDAGEVEIATATASGIALRAENTNTGVAIIADATNASNTFSTIQSSTNSTSNITSAIVGNSNAGAWGVSGQVTATATAESGVYGSNLRTNGGHGVLGIGFNGVVGQTNQSTGNAVYGENFDAVLPLGNGIGAAGKGYWGVVGEDRYLGGVAGAYGVLANGELGATGFKSFIIDHPMDPENKFLRHFSTESNEVLNIYRGNAVFNENGEAIVELPHYYEEININPSYNLTPVGGFAQLFIKEEISNGQFIIGGGTPGLKVSWTVYSQRNDPYMQAHPENAAVELEKREGQKGLYFMPDLYGQPDSKKLIQDVGNPEFLQPKIELKD
ncbi:MAG: hypothetical protein QNK23_08865 [Crocinitomicaceae bacterium]|nr:hypothetical protein [Crocinitomicaceae bacterium]